MLFIAFQLVVLFLATWLVISLFSKRKLVTRLLGILGALFFTAELSSVYLGNALIDFKYYFHFDTEDAISTGGFFLKEIALLGLALVLSFLGLMWLTDTYGRAVKSKWKFALLGVLISIGLLSMPNGVIQNILDINKLHNAPQKEFRESLNALGLKDYKSERSLKANAGKNIIVIILESVEASFLKGNLAHLTPNLNRMADEMTYYKMKQSEGSDYTIGAIYTYLTGFPHFFKNKGNFVFQHTVDLRVNGLPQILNKAGYNQLYMMGNSSFAGTDVMLKQIGLNVKSELDYEQKYRVKNWGLHDKDLFHLAKQELREFKKKGNPFALYFSTISTHHPDGVYDNRIAKSFPSQNSNLEVMVNAVDSHIADLKQFLEDEGMLENTVLYIVPDHTLHGYTSKVISEFEKPRELFLISNSKSSSYNPDDYIYQIDIPKVILEGAGVEHNQSFLTDIITGDKQAYIKKNKKSILQLNEASLTRDVPKEDINKLLKDYKQDAKHIFLRSQVPDKSDIPPNSLVYVGFDSLEVKKGVNLMIENNGKFDHEVYNTSKNEEQVKALLTRLKKLVSDRKNFNVLVHEKAGKLINEYGQEFENIGLRKLGNLKSHLAYIAHSQHGYTTEQTQKRTIAFRLPIREEGDQKKIISRARDRDRIIAHAGGNFNNLIYTNSLEALDDSYANGFRLFELDFIETSDGHYVAAHDWEGWKKHNRYTGKIPASREVFLTTEPRFKFTPMDMGMVNEWFAKHTDAILVTDKVNDPIKFSTAFDFKDRMWMELFSIDAVKKAHAHGVNDILLSENVFKDLEGDKVQALEQLGVSALAISIKTILKNKPLYEKLAKAGIKVYAFHINNQNMKDEAYMVRRGLDFCYGFYADEWRFL